MPVGQNLTDAVTAINAQATAAGITVKATENSGDVVFEAIEAGTAPAFTVGLTSAANAPVATVTKNTAGADVVGTINGATATAPAPCSP